VGVAPSWNAEERNAFGIVLLGVGAVTAGVWTLLNYARALEVRAGAAILVRAGGAPAGWWTAQVEPGALLEAAVADVGAARRIARAA
jgi:hypothetical protein